MPPTITTETGTIAVPMSTILDALEGVLTDAEREALLGQLVGFNPIGVAPGDLIEAELFNKLRNDLNNVMMRLAILEGAAGGPVIERVEPQGIDIPVGSLMTIVGRNFRPGSDTAAFIDGVEISAFNLQSDANRLIFTVPDSFAQLPRAAQVRVRVGSAVSNSVSVWIADDVPTQGGVLAIKSIGPALGTITVGTTYTLIWQAIPAARLTGKYSFTPVVTDVNGGTVKNWTDNIQINPTGPIEIASGVPVQVTMTVKVPPSAVSANISLSGSSDDNIVKGSASPIAFVVGAQPEQTDDRAALRLLAIPPIFNGALNPLKLATIGGLSGVTLPKNSASELPLELSVKAGDPNAAGLYKFRAVVEGETGRWTLGQPTPSSQANVTSASRPTFRIPVQSSNSGDTTTISNIVVYAERFASAGDAQPTFKSFIRFPIKGA